jgi:hypothetical protein
MIGTETAKEFTKIYQELEAAKTKPKVQVKEHLI